MNAPMAGRRLHLVGIGGAGMSGLAVVAAELGATVSGSDRQDSPYLQRLREAGVEIFVGHDPANVRAGAELVRSTAVADDNPELVAARASGQPVFHRSELLAELAALREICVTVAGSHGKTTTTAMIAHALDALGADPSYFVGGEVTIGPRTTNAHIGGGEIIVVEADESDGSFVRYAPKVAVVTNIEFEHPETWSNLDELLAAFARHLAPAERVIVKAEQARIDELELGRRGVTFSISESAADFFASELEESGDPAAGTSFRLGEIKVTLGVRGSYNVENALAALAALAVLGFDPQRAAPTLASFTGVARRFERVGTTASGAVVYDDYAHHPTEVRAALTAARGMVGDGRVVVFFQPHLFSRTIAYRREFAEALALADVAVVLDIFPARESAQDFPGVTGWTLASSVADHSGQRRVHYAPQLSDAEALASRILRPGDLCLTMGAGSITKLARLLAAG